MRKRKYFILTIAPFLSALWVRLSIRAGGAADVVKESWSMPGFDYKWDSTRLYVILGQAYLQVFFFLFVCIAGMAWLIYVVAGRKERQFVPLLLPFCVLGGLAAYALFTDLCHTAPYAITREVPYTAVYAFCFRLAVLDGSGLWVYALLLLGFFGFAWMEKKPVAYRPPAG